MKKRFKKMFSFVLFPSIFLCIFSTSMLLKYLYKFILLAIFYSNILIKVMKWEKTRMYIGRILRDACRQIHNHSVYLGRNLYVVAHTHRPTHKHTKTNLQESESIETEVIVKFNDPKRNCYLLIIWEAPPPASERVLHQHGRC